MAQRNPLQPKNLVRLGEIRNYRVAGADIDPRGWEVVGSDGRLVGSVRDLLTDPTELGSRYLEVAVHELGERTASRHVLLPLDHVSLEPATRTVSLATLDAGSIAQLPSFTAASVVSEPLLPSDVARERRIGAPFESRSPVVEPRRERMRRSAWRWAAAALALGVIAIGAAAAISSDDPVAVADVRTEGVPVVADPSMRVDRGDVEMAMPPAVQSYLGFVDQRPAAGSDGDVDAPEGIRRLGAALDELAGADPARHHDLAIFWEHAGRLGAGTVAAADQPGVIKHSMLSAVRALRSLQYDRAPESTALAAQIDMANAQAAAMRADLPLAQQDATVRRFFDESSRAIRVLARESSGVVVP